MRIFWLLLREATIIPTIVCNGKSERSIYQYSLTEPMPLKPALRNVLQVVGTLSHNDVNTNVVDSSVAQHVNALPSLEVYDCLDELKSLGLIKMLQPIGDSKEKKDDETFKILNITKAGLDELLTNQQNQIV